jgi:superoxide dismutase
LKNENFCRFSVIKHFKQQKKTLNNAAGLTATHQIYNKQLKKKERKLLTEIEIEMY